MRQVIALGWGVSVPPPPQPIFIFSAEADFTGDYKRRGIFFMKSCSATRLTGAGRDWEFSRSAGRSRYKDLIIDELKKAGFMI